MNVLVPIPLYIVLPFVLLVIMLLGSIIYGYNRVLKVSGDTLRTRKVIIVSVILLLWLTFICFLSTRHFLDQFSILPPRMAVVFFPPMFVVAILANSKSINTLLNYIPQYWLLFFQSFRIVTGIIFYLLFLENVIPVQMTFLGRNFDMLIGITAPLIGYLYLKKKLPKWLSLAWNILGLILLSVVIITAVLSAPFPFRIFQGQVSNTMIAYFPFVMMPGFVVPVGILMHIFSLKKNLKDVIAGSHRLNDRLIRYIGIPLIALLMALLLHAEFHSFSADYFFGFIFAFAITLLLWYGDRLIITKIRFIYPEYHQTIKRVLFQFIFIELFTFLTVLVIDTFLFVYVVHRLPTLKMVITDISIGKLVSAIMLIIYESIYFFNSWKQNIVEVEHLKNVQVQNQLDVLKNQINPHFLFNSLNSLASLVDTDEKMAIDFVQKMSEVYRYILQSNQDDFNSLGCETDFIEKYFYLLKIRFSNSLFYELDIPESYREMRLPQLSMQMLVDNAITYNILSSAKPLSIKIHAGKKNELIISNNLQPRQQVLHTSKFGLHHLERRFESLGLKALKVEQTETEFKICLPLIA